MAFVQSAFGANTADDYLTSAPDGGSLVKPVNWSLGALPTVTHDATFPSGSPTGIRLLTAYNLTVGSFNNLATGGTISLRNETTTATDSILTLGGAGNLGNACTGADPNDLLYVVSGGTLNILGDNTKGSGVLKVVLGQSGNFHAAGTLGITSTIGESGSCGITKTGAGTLTLSANNTYTGNTAIAAGTLTLKCACLADTSTVSIVSGAKLNLDTAGASDTVAALVLGGVTVPAGTYNSSHVTYGGYFAGTGSLVVGSPYGTWAAAYSGADLADPDADYDGDGMTNHQEYAFGLNPTLGSSMSPLTSPLGSAGMFTYTRRNPGLTALVYSVWTSPDLQNWTKDTGASQTPDSPSAATQTVSVTVTATPLNGKLFVRVQAAP